jgi:hypothetical protein
MEVSSFDSSDTNDGYYPSTIDTYLKSYTNNYFSSDIQVGMLNARVPYTIYSDDEVSVVSKSAMSSEYYTGLFLLSGEEVGCKSTDDDDTVEGDQLPNEGSCLAYFENYTYKKRIATYNGSNVAWWLRSQTKSRTNLFIDSNGYRNDEHLIVKKGIRPAIILDSTFNVDANNNIALDVGAKIKILENKINILTNIPGTTTGAIWYE